MDLLEYYCGENFEEFITSLQKYPMVSKRIKELSSKNYEKWDVLFSESLEQQDIENLILDLKCLDGKDVLKNLLDEQKLDNDMLYNTVIVNSVICSLPVEQFEYVLSHSKVQYNSAICQNFCYMFHGVILGKYNLRKPYSTEVPSLQQLGPLHKEKMKMWIDFDRGRVLTIEIICDIFIVFQKNYDRPQSEVYYKICSFLFDSFCMFDLDQYIKGHKDVVKLFDSCMEITDSDIRLDVLKVILRSEAVVSQGKLQYHLLSSATKFHKYDNISNILDYLCDNYEFDINDDYWMKHDPFYNAVTSCKHLANKVLDIPGLNISEESAILCINKYGQSQSYSSYENMQTIPLCNLTQNLPEWIDEAKKYCTLKEDSVEMSILNKLARNLVIRNCPYKSLLISAVDCYSMDTLVLLLSHKVMDINEANEKGINCLLHGLHNEHQTYKSMYNIINILIVHPEIQVNICDKNGNSALMLAVINKNHGTVLQLLRHKSIKINAQNKAGRTALMLALDNTESSTYAEEEQIDIISMLATHPQIANLNYQNRNGDTAVGLLMTFKQFPSVMKIMQHKYETHVDPIAFEQCNVLKQDIWDCILIAMKDSSETKHKSLFTHIIQKALALPNNGINKCYANGQTLLHKAATYCCDIAWYVFLSQEDVDLNVQDVSGNTAFMYAVKTMSVDCITDFLCSKKKWETKLHNKKGKTVIDIVNEDGINPTIEKLVKVGVFTSMTETPPDVMMKNMDVNTQIHYLKLSLNQMRNIHMTTRDQLVSQLCYIESELKINFDSTCGTAYSMDEIHQRKLRKLHKELVDEIDNPRSLLDHLYSDGIMTEDIMERIMSETTRRSRCTMLLLILPRRGPEAYDSFLKALRADGQGHVADKIETFNPEERPSSVENSVVPYQAFNPNLGHQLDLRVQNYLPLTIYPEQLAIPLVRIPHEY